MQTLGLEAGSSAVDAGNNSFCPAGDQWGVGRPQGLVFERAGCGVVDRATGDDFPVGEYVQLDGQSDAT